MSYDEANVDTPLQAERPKSAINLPPTPSDAFVDVVDPAFNQPRPERQIMDDIENSFEFSDTDYSGVHGKYIQDFFGVKPKRTFGPQNLPHKHKRYY